MENRVLVRLENVVKSFGDKTIIKNIDLDIFALSLALRPPLAGK